jgi:hypothetical protein
MGKRKLEFSFLGVILGGAFFFPFFILLHGYWIGEPFKSFSSIIVTTYLILCTAAFPYIIKELDRIDSYMERRGDTFFKGLFSFFFKGLLVLIYFVAPMVYIWLKFFEKKET